MPTIARERINFTLFVPTMIYVLLDHPALDEDRPLLARAVCCTAPPPMSPSRLVEGIERIGPVFSQLYGQTECYPVSVLRKADHDPKTPELFVSCGFPIAACEVKILDDDDQEVADRRGRRNLRARAACDGRILEATGQTAETLKNGWLHTGDIARARRARLHVHPRPQEGHDRLRRLQHLSARGRGRAHRSTPTSRCAPWSACPTTNGARRSPPSSSPREGARPDADELIALVKAKKGSAHAPKHIQFVKELPMTGVGKVDKKVLKASFWAGRERMVG